MVNRLYVSTHKDTILSIDETISPHYVKIKDVGQGNCTIIQYFLKEKETDTLDNSTFFIIDNGSEGQNKVTKTEYGEYDANGWYKFAKVEPFNNKLNPHFYDKKDETIKSRTTQKKKEWPIFEMDEQASVSQEMDIELRGPGDSIFILVSHWDADHISRLDKKFFNNKLTDKVENLYFIHPPARLKGINGNTVTSAKTYYENYITKFIANNLDNAPISEYDITVNDVSSSLHSILTKCNALPKDSENNSLKNTEKILSNIIINVPKCNALLYAKENPKTNSYIEEKTDGLYFYLDQQPNTREVESRDLVPVAAERNNSYSMLVFAHTKPKEVFICTGDRFLSTSLEYSAAENNVNDNQEFSPVPTLTMDLRAPKRQIHLLDQSAINLIKKMDLENKMVFFMIPHHGAEKNFSAGAINKLFYPKIWFFSSGHKTNYMHPRDSVIKAIIQNATQQVCSLPPDDINSLKGGPVFYSFQDSDNLCLYPSAQKNVFIMGTNMMRSIKYDLAESYLSSHIKNNEDLVDKYLNKSDFFWLDKVWRGVFASLLPTDRR